MDASFGGEEWLCVNYLYGPSAVLKRPRESRASMLLYLKAGPAGSTPGCTEAAQKVFC